MSEIFEWGYSELIDQVITLQRENKKLQDEIYKYKPHSLRISALNSCNDCGCRSRCPIVPQLGDCCRSNCAFWISKARADELLEFENHQEEKGGDEKEELRERNNPKPLTLDDLREMIGEPVWIEHYPTDIRMWVIVNLRDRPVNYSPLHKEECLILDEVFAFSVKDLGSAWNAYRLETYFGGDKK